MAAVRKRCRITMDTGTENCINVHRTDGTVMKFSEFHSGLYYYDTSRHCSTLKTNSTPVAPYIFLQSVDGNKLHFNRREIEGADGVRTIYRKLVRPADRDFL